MSNISDLKNLLKEKSKIALFSHTSPDADAISSCLAFKQMLIDNYPKKEIDIFIDAEPANFYSAFKEKNILSEFNDKDYDLAISLDCNSASRLGKFKDFYQSIKDKINIDHHASNERFGNINIVLHSTASTGELLYLMFKKFNLTITTETAKYIYIGIITDTNCFTSTAMQGRTHYVISEILKFNFDYLAIREYFFKNNSKSKSIILEKALHSLKFFASDHISYMKIMYIDIINAQGTWEDTLGIADQGITISGIDISIVVIEKEPENYYISLRSKDENVDVSEIAKKFDGGGHKTAAAFQCLSKNCLRTTIFNLVTECKEGVKNISHEDEQEIVF
ncbi:MAG: bifunctional oligoribonuclease/PAP phosphatase NrnA [Clostridia bacterium]|nr:bifunctional oligoribonuclease/PAP phosphatase NrnA [Clostridia bacterium]